MSMLVLSVVLVMPSVLAYNYQININSNINPFNTDVYKCTNSGCSSITSYASSTTGEYSLIGSGNNYYAEYDYVTGQSCFVPQIYIMHAWGDLSGTENYDISFIKQEDCGASIKSGTLSKTNAQVGDTITINTKIHSAFEYPAGVPSTTAIPTNIKDQYSSKTKIMLYVNGIKVDEKESEILLASDKDFAFTWTPTASGTYEIVVKSQVTDCACSSQETQSYVIGTLIVNETPECCHDGDCPDDYYSDSYCSNNDVYKGFHDFFCLNHECKQNITQILVTDCGSDYCGNYGNNYCSSGDIYHSRTCYNKGCLNGSCYSESYNSEQLVQECNYGCENGQCLPAPECCTDEDCQEDYYSNKYCINNSVYKDFHDFFCLLGLCNENVSLVLVETCDHQCVNGECIDEPECNTDSDCEEDYYSDKYCSNGDVYKDYHDFSCAIGQCKDDVTKELVEECDYGCSNGKCKSKEGERTWCIETNSCELTFDDSTEFDDSISVSGIDRGINQTIEPIMLNPSNPETESSISCIWIIMIIIVAVIILFILILLINLI